jgi:hypothetical protein
MMAEFADLDELKATLEKVLTQLLAEVSPYPTGESLDRVACFTLTAGKDGSTEGVSQTATRPGYLLVSLATLIAFFWRPDSLVLEGGFFILRKGMWALVLPYYRLAIWCAFSPGGLRHLY